MRPRVKPALVLCLLLLLPSLASAQTANAVERARRDPVGLALPGVSVAGAEEPTAVNLNPAGIGFVNAFTLAYFHEGGRDNVAGDAFYLAAPLGPLVPALSMEWVRPAAGEGPRYRKTTLGLALASGQVFSLGAGWNLYSSPDAAMGGLFSFDVGATVRPWRHLSLGAAVLGLQGRLAGEALPVRYVFGAATRLLGDALTLSGDLYCDDGSRGDFLARHGAVGLGFESRTGFGLQVQYQFPLFSGRTGFEGTSALLVALTSSAGGASFAGGLGTGGGTDDRRPWLVGIKVSPERYRGFSARSVPIVDVAEAAQHRRTGFLSVDGDPYGTLLLRLARVRDDPSVAGLVLRISQLPLGEGRVDELRAAVAEIRERKPVIAYLTGEMGLTGMRELLLACAASAVYAAPAGGLMVNGLSYSGFYLKDGLARLGVAFDSVATGPYKNAADPLTRSDMSAGEREALESLLDDRYARQVKAIAAARKLAEPRVKELLDQGLFNAEEAKRAGLVDAVLWPDELEEVVKRTTGVRPSKGLASAPPRAAQRWGPRPRIAVVRVHGAIAPGRSRRVLGLGAIAGSATVVRYLRQAAEDSSVKAIVLRVDSPGGDMVASDAIWRGVASARRAGKPVVVSMGDVAASGGYYVSAGADAIVAEPSTLTGSIGVLVLKPDLSGLLGKLEIRSRSLQRGERARIASFTKPWTPEERRLVERQVQAAYDLFLARVSEGRRLPREEVDRIARGRVWTGAQALERKLVDRLGSFGDALELAREKAGLAPGEAVVLRLEPEPGLLERVTAGTEEDEGGAGEGTLGRLLAGIPEVATLGVLAEMGPVLALPTPWLAPPEGP